MMYLTRRSAALFLLGLALNLLPYFDFQHVRVMGILQRIGICYFAAGAIALALGRRTASGFALSARAVAIAAAVVALGYGALLLAWDAPECGHACFDSVHSLPAVIDRAVFNVNHLWPYGLTNGQVTYEPEGLLSAIGALVNVLAGLAVGLILRQGSDAWLRLALAAIALLLAGFALDPLIPVVKKIWTPSFALLSSGFSLLVLILLRRLTAGTSAILAFGANATLAFVAISLLDCMLQLPLRASAPQSWHDSLARDLGELIADPRIASVTYSAGLLFVLGALLLTLYRKELFLRL
jgi:predicted acyltransferase